MAEQRIVGIAFWYEADERQIAQLFTSLAADQLFLISGCKKDTADASDEKPNFILLFTDELQFSDIGCYGGSIPTPEIDRLAAGGLRFTKAYTPASMCTPSRFSMLTCLYPGRCRAATFLASNPEDQPNSIAWNTWITREVGTIPTEAAPIPLFRRIHVTLSGQSGV